MRIFEFGSSYQVYCYKARPNAKPQNVGVHCSKTVKQTFYILTTIFIVACSDREQVNQEIKGVDTLTTKMKIIDIDTTDLQSESKIVTNEFLDLVRYLDSCGFISDSARFQKTYRPVYQRPVKIEDYLIYELSLEETIPIHEHKQHVEKRDKLEMASENPDTVQQKVWQDWKERWKLNFEFFEKADKITAYFYIEKSLLDRTGGGTYYDGIIEEWTFPDNQSAQDAAYDISRKETMVYVNRGAYICYLDNCMYVFHSRSAGFYTPLKKFLTYFADKNNATIPNRREQRKNY